MSGILSCHLMLKSILKLSVEVVYLVGMAVVDGPGFTSIQQGWNNYSLVEL